MNFKNEASLRLACNSDQESGCTGHHCHLQEGHHCHRVQAQLPVQFTAGRSDVCCDVAKLIWHIKEYDYLPLSIRWCLNEYPRRPVLVEALEEDLRPRVPYSGVLGSPRQLRYAEHLNDVYRQSQAPASSATSHPALRKGWYSFISPKEPERESVLGDRERAVRNSFTC